MSLCIFKWATNEKRVEVVFNDVTNSYAIERGWRTRDKGYLWETEFETSEEEGYGPEDILDLVDDLRTGDEKERSGYQDIFNWLLSTMTQINIGELRIEEL